ncbi:hypothetical protein F0562_002744 [Nyssa sinensis]|uniref:Germin-like protein n=1 Tax=Nyssa sinensis TaxID=561372 RepID=A0A5J5BXQ9_9ASTE|nr:hypothetical protein F0562_002744 [Nyssa sinensis]
MMFVSKSDVVTGFIDTRTNVFQKVLKEGDVFLFPRGLLHYFLNSGFELATVFSVLNSHNPGVVSIFGAMFAVDLAAKQMIMQRLISFSTMEGRGGMVVLYSLENLELRDLMVHGNSSRNPTEAPTKDHSELGHLVHEVRKELFRFRYMSCLHVHREGNSLAYVVASYA